MSRGNEPRTRGRVALAAGARRWRAGARRGVRARGRGARRELHRLPNRRSEAGARTAGAGALGVCAAEHPAANACGCTSRPGRRFDIDWSFLASIGAQECGNGDCAGSTAPAARGRCRSPTSAAARAALAPDRHCGNATPSTPTPASAPSVNDPADAIYTAARILREDMGAPPTGGSYAEYRQAACRYYGACADATVSYADEVMARAVQYGFTGTGAPARDQPRTRRNPSRAAAAARRALRARKPPVRSQIVRVAESQLGQGETPARLGLHDLRAVRGVVLSCSPPGYGSTPGVPLPGSTALYGYSGSLYTWAREHGGRVLPATARPSRRAMPSSTAPARATARTSGSCQHVYPDGRDHNHRGQLRRPRSPRRPIPARPRHQVGEAAPIYGYAQPPSAGPVKG